MEWFKRLLFLTLLLFGSFQSAGIADGEVVQLNATVLTASNEGTDFNLDNDAFRDQLIQLFSYSAYEQVEVKALKLPRSERVKLKLPEGYELLLTLQELETGRATIQALIRKGGQQYVYTVLSVTRPGVVFLGGPPLANGGSLIIVLESTGN